MFVPQTTNTEMLASVSPDGPLLQKQSSYPFVPSSPCYVPHPGQMPQHPVQLPGGQGFTPIQFPPMQPFMVPMHPMPGMVPLRHTSSEVSADGLERTRTTSCENSTTARSGTSEAGESSTQEGERTTSTPGLQPFQPSTITPIMQPAMSPMLPNTPTFHPMQFLQPIQPVVFPQQQQLPQMYVQVQTPQGPSLQPVLLLPDAMQQTQNLQYFGNEKNFLNPPGVQHHPMMQRSRSDSSLSFSRGSRRLSRSSRSNSSQFDGSEYSADNRKISSTSLRRFSSGQSDGYGSDYNFDNRSRIGSDYFTDEDFQDEESPKQYDGNNMYVERSHSAHSGRSHHYSSPDRVNKKRPTSKERQEELYKTELCNVWINQKKCRFGQRCIFAHGQHELRLPKRKLERNKMKPPLAKQVVAILSKLTEANSETMITEFLTACVEQVRSSEESVKGVVRSLFNRAVHESTLRHLYMNAWRKLLHVHPMAEHFKSAMFEMCLLEYATPRTKAIGLGCMEWIAQLVSRGLFDEEIVHKILSDVHSDNTTEATIELWCKLIESLKDRVDTSEYFDAIIARKAKYGQRIRFLIMDLEELRKCDWVPHSRG